MNEDFYIGLIYKELDGTLTSSEQQQLSDWESSNEANALTARSVRTAWELSGDLNTLPNVDLDEEFAQLQSVLGSETTENKVIPIKRPKRNWRRISSIAAAILILPMLFFLINNVLNKGGEQWIEIATTAGEKQSLVLSDGTKVTINENSTFKYPNTFKGTERNVELIGEAFFDVESNPQQAFKIKGANLAVEVLGTSFSVKDRRNQAQSQVVVQEGKVAVSTLDNSASLELIANEVATFLPANQNLEKSIDPNLNTISWYTNKLVFKDTPFSEMIETLMEQFQVDIQVENPALQSCTFDVTFEEEGLETILATLETVFGLSIESREEAAYLLKGGSCQ